MPELLKLKVLSTGDIIEAPDVEPLESAQAFVATSDKIWERRSNPNLSFTTVSSVISPIESRDAINEAVRQIDEKLVISGTGKALELSGMWPGQKVVLSPEYLDAPSGAGAGTFNWDSQATWRHMDIDGQREVIEFVDGHTDFHRELYVQLSFTPEDKIGTTILKWAMQRYQPQQNLTASLWSHAWVSRFAESGYEGNALHSKKLSEKQELEFIKLVQKIGGISLGP